MGNAQATGKQQAPRQEESSMIDHRRDDLDFLPCDCELPTTSGAISTPPRRFAPEAPAVANVGHPCSYYLRLPPRTLSQAVKDISRYRDLPTWVYELLPRFHRPLIDMTPFRPATACVVSLAAERARRVR
jgi:hypothetical protein